MHDHAWQMGLVGMENGCDWWVWKACDVWSFKMLEQIWWVAIQMEGAKQAHSSEVMGLVPCFSMTFLGGHHQVVLYFYCIRWMVYSDEKLPEDSELEDAITNSTTAAVCQTPTSNIWCVYTLRIHHCVHDHATHSSISEQHSIKRYRMRQTWSLIHKAVSREREKGNRDREGCIEKMNNPKQTTLSLKTK